MWEYGGQLWRQTRPPKSRHLFATIFFCFLFSFFPHATILESDSGNDQNWKTKNYYWNWYAEEGIIIIIIIREKYPRWVFS